MSLKQLNECITRKYLTEGKNIDRTWEQYKSKIMSAEVNRGNTL